MRPRIQEIVDGLIDEMLAGPKPVDLVERWRVIFAVVVLEFNASTFFGNGLDTGGIGDASTRS